MRASNVPTLGKRTSELHAYEMFNQQDFKANNVLLWLWIPAVSCESSSTAEITLMMWIYFALYSILRWMCAAARYYDISPKQIVETFLLSTIQWNNEYNHKINIFIILLCQNELWNPKNVCVNILRNKYLIYNKLAKSGRFQNGKEKQEY